MSPCWALSFLSQSGTSKCSLQNLQNQGKNPSAFHSSAFADSHAVISEMIHKSFYDLSSSAFTDLFFFLVSSIWFSWRALKSFALIPFILSFHKLSSVPLSSQSSLEKSFVFSLLELIIVTHTHIYIYIILWIFIFFNEKTWLGKTGEKWNKRKKQKNLKTYLHCPLIDWILAVFLMYCSVKNINK